MPSFPNRSFPVIVRWLNRFAQGVAPGVTVQLERFAELPLPVRRGEYFHGLFDRICLAGVASLPGKS